MTLLLLYAFCVGIVSSRRIERACYEDLEFRVLTGNKQPDLSRISEFRRRKLDALKDLLTQILRLCQKTDMVSLGHVALDGTKVQANARKHTAPSHERMLNAEKQLEKEINALMHKAEILDAQEDRHYGKGNRGSELPGELRRRQDRLAGIRQAHKGMEAETAAAAARQRQAEAQKAGAQAAAVQEAGAAAAEQAELNRKAEVAVAKAKAAKEKAIEAAKTAAVDPPELEPLATDAMPRRGMARKADGSPTRKSQRNVTDADSHLMQTGCSYLQAYNCQLAVDHERQIIVAAGVSKRPPDREHLGPLLQRITASTGELPDGMAMDAGDWSEGNAKICADQGIDAYIATGRLPHGQPPPPKRGPHRRVAGAKTRMARNLRSKKGSRIYAQRKAIVEPVNGQVKEVRALRRFLLWGPEKVDAKWHLIATTHNLLQLFRFRRSERELMKGTA